MLPQRPRNGPRCSGAFSRVAAPLGRSLLPCLLNRRFDPLLLLLHRRVPRMQPSFRLSLWCSSSLAVFLFCFVFYLHLCVFCLLVTTLTEFIRSSLKCVDHLITVVSSSASGRPVSIAFSSFSGALSRSFVWDVVSSFRLPPCVHFCVSGRAATSPGFGRVGFCSRHPAGPGGSLPGRLSRVLRVWLLCGLCVPSCCH